MNKLFYGDNLDILRKFVRDETVNGVQTAQSIALIAGLEKVLGKGSLFAHLVSMTVHIPTNLI